MNDAELLELCEHPELKPELSATTSLMHIAFTMFGFKCVKCGKVWDVGNLAEAIQQHGRLLREKQEAERRADALLIFPIGSIRDLIPAGGFDAGGGLNEVGRAFVEGYQTAINDAGRRLAALKEPKT